MNLIHMSYICYVFKINYYNNAQKLQLSYLNILYILDDCMTASKTRTPIFVNVLGMRLSVMSTFNVNYEV